MAIEHEFVHSQTAQTREHQRKHDASGLSRPHTASLGTDGRRLDPSTCHLPLVSREGLQDVLDSMTEKQRLDFVSAMYEDRRIQNGDNQNTDSSSMDDSDSDGLFTYLEQQLTEYELEPGQEQTVEGKAMPLVHAVTLPSGPQPTNDVQPAAAGTRQPFQRTAANAPKKRGRRGAGKSQKK